MQYLFGRNFCEQQLVLGKLLNTVKWSTFCVSFVRLLKILGWLQCIEIFKIDYLVTSNVRFGTSFHKSSHIYLLNSSICLYTFKLIALRSPTTLTCRYCSQTPSITGLELTCLWTPSYLHINLPMIESMQYTYLQQI